MQQVCRPHLSATDETCHGMQYTYPCTEGSMLIKNLTGDSGIMVDNSTVNWCGKWWVKCISDYKFAFLQIYHSHMQNNIYKNTQNQRSATVS